MRAVAVNAHRPARVALGEQLAVNALVVGLLDADVALAAGLGDVGVVDRRIAVHAALDFVRAVTVVARGRDDQAHFQQRGAVDAVHVLVRGLGKFDLVFLGEIGVAVALRAGRRQIHFIHGRMHILHRQNFVDAVAVPALRRAGRAHGVAHAVDAGGVILAFLFVTAGAVRRRHDFVVHHLLDAVVAVNAVQLAVDGLGKTVGGKQRHRFGMAIDGALVRGVGVAVEAVGVFQLVRREDSRRQQQQRQGGQAKPFQNRMRSGCHTPQESAESPLTACHPLPIAWHFLAGDATRPGSPLELRA